MLIKELPLEERPRERLLKVGVSNLSDVELLSIILKTGTSSKSVKELAIEILSKITNLGDLEELSLNKLMEVKGIGNIKAMEVICSIELGRRIFLRPRNRVKKILNCPDLIFEECKYLFMGKKQEYFYCLYFNSKQELIKKKLLFIGTLNQSVVHPREVFKEAYLVSASSIVCLHNHPSNDTRPSKEDIRLTNTLMEIGKLQAIPVIDHIIVGDNSYYSFMEHQKEGQK